jgi:POT family proton-dependent oligopeptide transporter
MSSNRTLRVTAYAKGVRCGGIKSNVGPLIAEQYSMRTERVKTLPSGEMVIVDPNITVQTVYARYYW